ncbi:MAG: dynamin family protein [Tepidisphaeraceae bacterium]
MCEEAKIVDLPSTLEEAVSHIESAGSDFSADCTNLTELKDRLVSGRFHLAVLGQFKRGKSTLLNALLGQDVLPTAVVPLTTAPTWVSAGELPRARVEFIEAVRPEEFATTDPSQLRRFLARFVTESGNPCNRLGVAAVRVFLPAPILRNGVVFIDTPGIGSTLRHNTETTLHFLPQCDAALFLVSADPPITETEVEFLKQVGTRVSRLFFVLNKIDYLNPSEASEAAEFYQKVIVEQAGINANAPVFSVSAKVGLQARTIGDSDLWTRSGMAQVERHLLDFLANEKRRSLCEAVRHKAGDIVADVISRLRLALRSLELPLEDLQSRLHILGRKVEELRREQVAAHDLLAGDSRRAHELLEQEYEKLCQRGMIRLNGAVDAAVSAFDSQPPDEEHLQERLRAEIPDLFDAEFKNAIRFFDQHLADVLRSHEQRSDRLIESIRKTAADLFDVPYRPMNHFFACETTREPYWVAYHWEQGFGPVSPSVVDKFMPPGLRRRRIERRFRDKVEALVLYNAGKLREKFYDQIDALFRRFRNSLDERLTATIAATLGAARAAMEKRHSHAGAVADDVQRLSSTIAYLQDVGGRLNGSPGQH